MGMCYECHHTSMFGMSSVYMILDFSWSIYMPSFFCDEHSIHASNKFNSYANLYNLSFDCSLKSVDLFCQFLDFIMLLQQNATKVASGTAQATQLLLGSHNKVWKHSGLHMMQARLPTNKKLWVDFFFIYYCFNDQNILFEYCLLTFSMYGISNDVGKLCTITTVSKLQRLMQLLIMR